MSDELERRAFKLPAPSTSTAMRFLAVLVDAFASALVEASELAKMDRWLQEQGRCICCGDVIDGSRGRLVACKLCYHHLEAGIRWDEVHPERSAAAEWESYANAIEGELVDDDDVG